MKKNQIVEEVNHAHDEINSAYPWLVALCLELDVSIYYHPEEKEFLFLDQLGDNVGRTFFKYGDLIKADGSRRLLEYFLNIPKVLEL
jgi:hypothetical protein